MLIFFRLIFFLVLLNPAFIFAQDKEPVCKQSLKLYQSYDDYVNKKPIDTACLSLKENRFNRSWGRVVIKEKNKSKRRYTHGSLWGYQRGETLYRYFDDGKTFGAVYGYLELVDSNGLFIYAFREMYNYGIIGAYKIHYHYSKGLDAPIKELKMKNLREDIHYDSFLEDVKEIVADLVRNKRTDILNKEAVDKFNTKYRA